ncbi:MAG: TPM domain-containing protein [Filimonas sp.]|nr:TPM domain-containing protein [Filimonas sp.]
MKRFLFLALLLITRFSSFAQDVLPKPVPTRLVTDKAKLLSSIQVEDLERRLDAFADSTTIQVAIVTIPSLNGVDLESYALKLFNTWGIGQKDKNNGLLILVAAKERKVRIEVGFGLERYVTNDVAAAIIKNNIVPFFKKNQHYLGLLKASTALCNESLPSVKAEAEQALQMKMSTPPAFSPDFNKPEVSAGMKWGIGGFIFAVFLSLLVAISWISKLIFPGGWNYGQHQYMRDSSYYNTDNSFSHNDSSSSSSSDSDYSSDFGGGDSGGSGASDTW